MPRPIRTALFVDFDNVFGSLYSIRPSAAEAFGMHPNSWMHFFERGQHAGGRGGEHEPRSILMRKCYMNPDGFITSRGQAKRDDDDSEFRADPEPEAAINPTQPVQFRLFRRFFTSAGFSVIDCPALTSRAKNSADIVMVMDILASLAHKVEIEEFIILSADADFTPVLIHLREHDRRTAVYANKFTAVAYRAASDILIDEHDFMARALDVGGARTASRGPATALAPVQPPPKPEMPLGAIAREVGEELTRVSSMTVSELARFLGKFPTFTDPTMPRWLGCGTAIRMMTELTRNDASIMLDSSTTENIRLVARHAPPSAVGVSAFGQRPSAPEAWSVPGTPLLLSPERDDSATDSRLAAPQSPMADSPASQPGGAGFLPCALQAVHEILAASEIPVLLSVLGTLVRQRVPELPPKWWPGGGSLQAFLLGSRDPRIKLLQNPRTFVYDPVRHDPGTAPGSGSGRRSQRGDEQVPAADIEDATGRDAVPSPVPIAAELLAAAELPRSLHDPILPAETAATPDEARALPGTTEVESWAVAAQPQFLHGYTDGTGTIVVPLAPKPTPDPVPAADENFSRIVLRAIHIRLGATDAPMALGDLDEALRASLPAAACWPDGTESLEAFIRISGDSNLGILPINPCFVFDRMRHDPYALTVTAPNGQEQPSPALRSLVEMVGEITECPRPSPERHRILWQALTEELRDLAIDLQGQWGLRELELAVETRCQELGTRLSRATIRYVIDGLAEQGALTKLVDGDTPRRLAAAYAEYLAELCRVNRETLSAAEIKMLRLWMNPDSEIDQTADDLAALAASASDDGEKQVSDGQAPADGNGFDPDPTSYHSADDKGEKTDDSWNMMKDAADS